MKSTAVPSRTISIVVLVFMTATAIHAMQERSAGSSSGTFENHGEVTVGYRFTDVKGYRPQYLQLFDLRDGFRVQDFILHGDSCLLYTSPSPRDSSASRMPSSA